MTIASVRRLLSVAAILLVQPRVSAIDADVTAADVQRAIGIAVSGERARALFHESYRVPANDPMFSDIEVITEFRRFVIASEEQLVLGNWMLARGGFDSKGRTLKDMLRHLHGQVSIRIHVRFHPHHWYNAIPLIETSIGEPSFLVVDVIRTPIWSNAEAAGSRGPMSGAVLETFFNAPSFHDQTLPLRVLLEGKELVRASVDFSKLE